jgi:DNA-binding NtrC family response regulator
MTENHDFQTDPTTRLLLTTDDPLTHNSLSQFLSLEGYQVDTATNGSQAIAMLEAKHYRLVVTDVTDGLMLTGTIRNRYPHVVVVVLTCYDMIESAEETVRRGAFAYLVRPIIDDEIRVTIRSALQSPHRPYPRLE